MGNEIAEELLNGLMLDKLNMDFVSVHLKSNKLSSTSPIHHHSKAQLVMPIHGMITCTAGDGIWLVPEGCAIWIPENLPHSNKPSSGASFCFTYVDSALIDMPKHCCTLSISPLIREIILHLSNLSLDIEPCDEALKLIDIFYSQIVKMPIERLNFPTPSEPRLQKIANLLIAEPADRRTAEEWASLSAMSSRTLARLLYKETGMNFRDWRRQLHIIVALQKLSEGCDVNNVSFELGYESVSAFITMFKKVLGKPPKQYVRESPDNCF